MAVSIRFDNAGEREGRGYLSLSLSVYDETKGEQVQRTRAGSIRLLPLPVSLFLANTEPMLSRCVAYTPNT